MSSIHGRSVKAIRFFREQPAALSVYWLYCAHRNQEGVAWPSLKGLVHESDWSLNPCADGRAWLVEHDALEPVEGYIRPEWRKLPEKLRKRRINLDKSEYYRVTGKLTIDDKTYDLLYIPAEDAEGVSAGDESAHDVSPDDTSSKTQNTGRRRITPREIAATIDRPHDVSQGDPELDSITQLPSEETELDSITTSEEQNNVVAVVVDEKDQSSWSAAFHQLEMQLDRASFDTWCRGAVLRQVERPTSPQPPSAPVFVVGVRNIYARDMLQHRLYRNVRRVLSDCSGEAVELRFEVNTPTATPLPRDDESGGVPPFRLLADQQPAMTQEGETIRTLFARFIGPVTEKNEASVKLLETQYSPETFGYALSVMAEKQAAGRVKDALSYTQGILRKLK